MTTYISTPFSILPSEWDNGIVINNPCAARINRVKPKSRSIC